MGNYSLNLHLVPIRLYNYAKDRRNAVAIPILQSIYKNK